MLLNKSNQKRAYLCYLTSEYIKSLTSNFVHPYETCSLFSRMIMEAYHEVSQCGSIYHILAKPAMGFCVQQIWHRILFYDQFEDSHTDYPLHLVRRHLYVLVWVCSWKIKESHCVICYDMPDTKNQWHL